MRPWRASSCVRRAKAPGTASSPYSALALAFRRTAELTIRGGGKPYSNMALMPTDRMGPPPGASPPMRMTASWSGSEWTYRIQVRDVKMRRNGELPSDHTQIGNVATRAPQEKPVSLFILRPRAQASRRCETQVQLSGKPLSCAKRFGPLTPSARSGNLIVGDGTKNGLPAPNKELAINRKQPLDRKSPIQVRIRLPPAVSPRTLGPSRDGTPSPGSSIWPPSSFRIILAHRCLRGDLRDPSARVGLQPQFRCE